MAEERVQRRLAAILAADVVGYSRLMGEDEEGTHTTLRLHRTELIDPCISEHRGRVVKNTGDGLIAEFSSVVDAVNCAIGLQEGMADRNRNVSKNRQIEFRIGVNLGDVIVEEDDVFGDGVNIAARLEGLAEPGGICVSDAVHQNIRSKIDLSFDDLGPQHVKNIGDPVSAFHVLPDTGPQPVPEPKDLLTLPAKPSIAVLPFDNMSSDVEQEYFSDGITEDIITELSKISGLFVIARHSAFTYKGKSVTLKQIGRELGVSYVLEGSVRKAGQRLRITAQLIDAANDHHVWAERYDREIKDIFEVQDEVARQVSAALAVSLKPEEQQRLAHAPTSNVEAYDLYMRARTMAWPPTFNNVLSARRVYERVTEVDPQFAGGYAGRSLSYSTAVFWGYSDSPEVEAKLSTELAQKAVKVDPEFARSHSALGLAHSANGRSDEAIESARRAVELQPGDADSHAWLARCLMYAGAGDAACDEARTALRIDPQYVNGPYYNLLGYASFVAGRFADTIEAFERNDARGGPHQPVRFIYWAAACGHLGRFEEAKERLQDLAQSHPDLSLQEVRRWPRIINRGKGERDLIIDGLRLAGMSE